MVSKQCKKEILLINDIVNKALKEIEKANERVSKTENMLKVIRQTAEENLKKAYLLGFEAGKKNKQSDNETSGGRAKEEETKLVLKPD